MSNPIAVLCLLLTTGTLTVLGVDADRYHREGGTFSNIPGATIIAPSRLACSAKCATMQPWFCRGFTYHEDGTCDLFKGDEGCHKLQLELEPLAVDSGSSGPPSYRLQLHPKPPETCPGTESEPCGCPAGFSRCAGRCLKLLSARAPYAEALSACAELSAHLAVPRSEAENRCVLDIGTAQGDILLGVNDITTDGTFVGEDGTCGALPQSQTWWTPEEPNNWGGSEDCVIVRNQAWNDIPCTIAYYPVCQLTHCYRSECP